MRLHIALLGLLAIGASGCATRSGPYDTLVDRGLRHAVDGRFDEAAMDFRTATALAPPTAAHTPDVGLALLQEVQRGGLQPVAAARLFEGLRIERCDRLIDLAGGDPGQWACHQRAFEKYSEAVALQGHAWSYTLRGITLYRQHKLPDAISDFDRAISHDSTIPLTYVNRANAYDAAGRHDDAAVDWIRAAALDPRIGAIAFTNLGRSSSRRGEHAAAVAAFARVIALRPDWAEGYYNRALANQLAGDPDSARADAIRALQLGHRQAEALIDQINAGKLYRR